MSDTRKEILSMTAETVGRDLLQALVQEIKLLPDVWPKMSQSKQNDVIDRLRDRVATNVGMAVHLIAAEGRTVVAGDLDQITIKDGVKAVIKFSANSAGAHELFDSCGKAVLVVVASATQHTAGMQDVKGESDQRAMDLGQEYDPKGDGKGMDGAAGGDDNVVDAEIKTLPHTRLQSELEAAYGDGKLAAQEGKGMNACPVMAGDLCIEWIKGWKAWHVEHPAAADDSGTAEKAPGRPVKYRHPSTEETWSGRGRQPKWVTDHLDAGGTLADLTADDEATTGEGQGA